MENKPQNVFEKLDRQGDIIDDISSKLEGISIEDLYALAKRTWDYDDYQTAQKYYNHISLLRPLDWEAPLYASLCNFKGSHQVDFWEYGLNKASKVLISTINYINNLNKSLNDKEKEMARCIEVIKEFMIGMEDLYFENKDIFDAHISDFVCRIETFYYDIYLKALSIDLDSLNQLKIFIANNILDLIEKTKEVSSSITKEVFNDLILLSKNKASLDYELISKSSNIESTKELSIQEKNEIKLKGTIYFDYNDKVISERLFVSKIFVGSLLSVLTITGIIFSFLFKSIYSLFYILPMLYGIYLIASAICFRKRIKCSSILCTRRLKSRPTSNGNVVTEKKFNLLQIIFTISSYLLFIFVFATWFIIFNKEDINLTSKIMLTLSSLLSSLIYFIAYLVFANKHHSKFDGVYLYFYKGKYYRFDK